MGLVPIGGVAPAGPDGVVDGEATGEYMGFNYDDANGATDGGGDVIGSGDDIVYGNGGNDTISAGGGDDTVYGGTERPHRTCHGWL